MFPNGYKPITVLAGGKPGDISQSPDNLKEMEQSERRRKELKEIVFSDSWGMPFQF